MSNKQPNILDELKQTGASVLKISKETGIPANRMYKWYEGKGTPKYEDVQILKAWLAELVQDKEEMTTYSNIPSFQTKGGVSVDVEKLYKDLLKEKDERIKQQQETIEILKTMIQRPNEKR